MGARAPELECSVIFSQLGPDFSTELSKIIEFSLHRVSGVPKGVNEDRGMSLEVGLRVLLAQALGELWGLWA